MRVQISKLAGVLKEFAANESGATMVEYGIMIALVAAIVVAVVKVVGTKMNNGFENVNSTF